MTRRNPFFQPRLAPIPVRVPAQTPRVPKPYRFRDWASL